ncbi:MAG: MarR family winged helix-turn-helix transcriptional regulator [Saprospiraceae bacterium]
MATNKFSPYNHFGFLTNRTGRLIVKMMDPELKRMGYDIPSSCIGILGELWEKDGLNQKELGMSIIKTKSSINKMLQYMIAADLIVKKTDEEDKRVSRIFLTQKGKELKAKIQKKSKDLNDVLELEHSSEEIEIAKKVLTTLYHRLLEKTKGLNSSK